QDLGKSQSGYTATEVHEVENTLSALAVDFGTAFYTGFKDLRVSMSVRNFSREIGYHEEDFPMPLTFSFGMAMDVLSLTKLGEIHKLTLAIDAIHPRDYPERFNLGMEYWVGDLFAIRAGYKTVTDEEGLSAGLGFKKTLGSMDVKIDYSYSDFGLFESVHRTSVGFGF
ncbi:MAG: PorV/PorQ family protein, partial [Aliifodinibius sp.]|nr:PorV/PorQ family protein [Fodinibius sp.]NIV15815.1 PorV/PorQ family protein [Fodinibius sp.]NIY29709.1 PorV/PorQ family protein [Fodinibius sp.]